MTTSVFRQRDYSAEAAEALTTGGLHPLLARLYAARGVSNSDQLALELKHLISPAQLSQCLSTASILADALAAKKPMLVVADYDCDGATACAVAVRGLRLLGGQNTNIHFLVPNRFTMGYGLTPEVVDLAATQIPKPAILITVDNGIASDVGVERARELGMDVIVTDHHLPGDIRPKALAIVNPNQTGCNFPSKALAGVGVVFYLLIALRAELRQRGIFTADTQPKIENLLDLVALGTVADVAQLDYNNRILVANGLQRMRRGIGQPGITALFSVAGRDIRKATAGDLGFAIGPRLNAAGRLADMTLGIQLLLTDDADDALRIAQELDRINRERRVIEGGMQEAALGHLAGEQLDGLAAARSALCLWNANWHQGVVGIVASRLKERFNRPAIVFAPADTEGAQSQLRGSGRSISGFHLRDALDLVSKREPGLILKFGGHAMAAGLTIDQANFARFDDCFQAVADELLDDALLARQYIHDGSLRPNELTAEIGDLLAEELWGQGFPQPVFYGEFEVLSQALMKEKHLRLQLKPLGSAPGDKPVGGVWFNHTQTLPARAHLAYRLVADRFGGQTRVQLLIEALDEDSRPDA
jgi:single-stranded-DNA-specific exonuclease